MTVEVKEIDKNNSKKEWVLGINPAGSGWTLPESELY